MPRSTDKALKPAGTKRGVKASKFVFTPAQDNIIRNYCEELKNNINNFLENPAAPLRDPKLTEWKQSTADKILALPDFSSLDMTVHSEHGWKVGIVNRFTNFFNSNIKKTLISGGQPVRRNESGPAEADKLLRTFALLSNDLSGREYYGRKHPKLLQETTEAIHERQSNISRRTARNKALSELWNELLSSEKNDWKERAEAYAMDIEKNQMNFPDTIALALQTVMERGRLGTGIIGLSYAFRTEEREIQIGSVHVGINMGTGKPISTKVDDPEWQSAWKSHAERVLPVSPFQKPSFVKLDEGATPVFPELNVNKETPDQLSFILEDYITKLWAKASPANPRSDVLWEQLHEDPAMYYDNEKFTLPARLRPASEYENPADIYALAKYFGNKQREGVPFRFTRFNELPSESEPEDDAQNDTTKSKSKPEDDKEPNHVHETASGSALSARDKKKNCHAKNQEETVPTENEQQPSEPRILRKRGPTGIAIRSTTPKRLADLPEVDMGAETKNPAKRKKNYKGYAYVQVTAD